MSQLLRRLGYKLIELFPVRNGGDFTNQFQVSDTHDGIPPKVGLFAVLHLNGSEILVRFCRELPYEPGPLDGNVNNLGANDYRYVRPRLDATQIAVGRHVTLFVGSAHFLVVIDKILQSSNVTSGIRCTRTVQVTVTPPTPPPVPRMMPDSPQISVAPSPSHLSPTRLVPPPRTAPRSIRVPPPAEIVSGPRTSIQGSRRKKPGLPPTPETSPEPRSFISLSEHAIPRHPISGSSSIPRSSPDAPSSHKDLPELPDTASSRSSSSTSSYSDRPPARAPNPRRQAFVAQLLPASSRRAPTSTIVPNSISTGPPFTQQRSSLIETPVSSAPQALNNPINTGSLRRHPSLRPRTTPFISSPLSQEIRPSSATSTQPNNANTGMDALNFLTIAEAPTPTATVTGAHFNLPLASGNGSSITTASNSGSRGSRHSRSSSVAVQSTRTPSSSASPSEKGKKRHSHNGSSSRASAPGPARSHEVTQSRHQTQSLSLSPPTPVSRLDVTLSPIAPSSPSTPAHRRPSSSLYCHHYMNTTHAQSTAAITTPNPNVATHITRATSRSSSSRLHASQAIASGSGSSSGAVSTGSRNDHESLTQRRDAHTRRSHQTEVKEPKQSTSTSTSTSTSSQPARSRRSCVGAY